MPIGHFLVYQNLDNLGINLGINLDIKRKLQIASEAPDLPFESILLAFGHLIPSEENNAQDRRFDISK